MNLRNSLVKNIASLFSIHISQYIIPLLLIPYLLKALGTSQFGTFCVATAYGGYIQVLCDYGFHLTGTQKISQHRTDLPTTSRIISSILLSKLILSGLGIIIAISGVFLVPKLRLNAIPIFIACISSIGGSFLPTWLFQGMERPALMAKITIPAKILQFGIIISLVHKPNDLVILLVILAITNILTTAIAWSFAWTTFNFSVKIPSLRFAINELINGFEIFLSQVGALLFSNTNIIVLNMHCTPSTVAQYAIAEKIIRAITQLGSPIGSALFPRIALTLHSNPSEARRVLKQALTYGSLFFLFLGITTAGLSQHVIPYITNDQPNRIAHLIWILSPIPLTTFVDNIFGTQILLNYGKKLQFTIGTMSAGIIALFFQFILIPKYSGVGAAISLTLSGSWIMCYFIVAAVLCDRKSFFAAPYTKRRNT